ncbi:MAG: 2-hydroxyacyl-CoA dehydratase family protein [Thermodesulfobacteriota bacterium]
MTSLEELSEMSKTIANPAVDKWKAQGKPVVGFFCSYIPEEILHAAGIFPYRIKATGCTNTPAADAFLSAVNCSFARSCLELALEGGYWFLDGVVSMNSCEHIRRLYDILKRKVKTPYYHFLSVPHKTDEEAVNWYRDELAIFKAGLEKAFDVSITEESIRKSIAVYNETRDLLRKVYEFRQRGNPLLTGKEAHEIVVAAMSTPKEDYNRLLKGLLEEVGKRKGISTHSPRLMVMGSVIDDPDYIGIIEGMGCLVVTDALCFGSRYFWEPVKTNGDLMECLARSYLKRPVCPRMSEDIGQIVTYTKGMVEKFNVDGVIMERIRCCDLWGGTTLILQKRLDELNIPLLVVDREYMTSGAGQMSTRVGAFLEMIGRG